MDKGEERARRDGIVKRALEDFDTLPDSAYVNGRVVDRLNNWSRSTRWRKVKEGNFPPPVSFGSQSNRWRVGDIRAHFADLAGASS